MKHVISLVMMLMGSLMSGAPVVAACNGNVDIVSTKPDSLYIDHKDGTVTDTQTGLMWQKCSLGLSDNTCTAGTAINYTWQAALAAANINTDYRYSDWRLPNINELKSLLDDACYGTTINSSVFPSTVSTYYWSSSQFAGKGSHAWGAYFGGGSVIYVNKDSARTVVRLVRGSQ